MTKIKAVSATTPILQSCRKSYLKCQQTQKPYSKLIKAPSLIGSKNEWKKNKSRCKMKKSKKLAMIVSLTALLTIQKVVVAQAQSQRKRK